MMMDKQPERSPQDGPIAVSREEVFVELGEIVISAEHNGLRTYVRCSEHNAWRLLVALGLVLGADLPSRITKNVKM